MASAWSTGSFIDLTDEDDQVTKEQSTTPTVAGRIPPPPMLSTTPILPPPQPEWFTTASSTPVPPPVLPNFNDATIPSAKRQKVKHDILQSYRIQSGTKGVQKQAAALSRQQQQYQKPTSYSPAPVPQPSFAPSPLADVRPSIETLDSSSVDKNGPHTSTRGHFQIVSSVDYEIQHNDVSHTPSGEYEPVQCHQPSPPRLLRKRPVRNTRQRQKARARALKWQGGRAHDPSGVTSTSTPERTPSKTFGISQRPYLSGSQRREVAAGKVFGVDPSSEESKITSQVIHVDFADDENRYLRNLARIFYRRPATGGRPPMRDLRHVLKKDKDREVRDAIISSVQKGFEGQSRPPINLLGRSAADIENYMTDLITRRFNAAPQMFRLEPERPRMPVNKVPHLLFARETSGQRGFGSLRQYQDFNTTFRADAEDFLEPRMEFTDCAGDVVTISWLSDNDFICGATTHSDSHNQQYNKPGNLALGNIRKRKLVAYPDHRIVRPIVSHGDNALDSMRQSQDPWLFTSVVDSAYSTLHQLAFTSSFDHTVKVWRQSEEKMHLVGIWPHKGRVNFVATSGAADGVQMVATAADVPENAVRVYHLSKCRSSGDNLEEQLRNQLENQLGAETYSRLPYREYSCSRITEEGFVPSEKWAYYPAAISWGKALGCEHLLLVGYSPRSREGYTDHDIPEDKLNTGELCVFDTLTGNAMKVHGAAMQNVFEVVWHPFFACFAAATSTALGIDGRTTIDAKTQVRIFDFKEGMFGVIKVLDCPAADINVLTMKPNSRSYSYITASCTNNKVYVWDSARETDRPMCILEHDDPVDEIIGDREQEDVGVTFTAWGSTSDRLYTGASDGVVKVWNIRHVRRGKGQLIRDLIELQGPITAGAFSRDRSKLAIGDATGKVCIMTHDDADDEPPMPGLSVKVDGTHRAIRPPRPIQLHPEVAAPESHESHDTMAMSPEPEDGPGIGARWLRKQELILKPGLGVFKGPNYSQIGLYRNEFHLNEDPTGPLLAEHQAKQQTDRPRSFWPTRRQRNVVSPTTINSAKKLSLTRDANQLQKDFTGLKLDSVTEAQLQADRVEYDARKVDYVFVYEDDDDILEGSSEDEDMESSSSDDDDNEEDVSSEEEDDEDVEITSRPLLMNMPLVQSPMVSSDKALS